MFKRIFLIFSLFLYATFLNTSGDPPKSVSLINNQWLQITQYNDYQYSVDKEIRETTYPSFIVTKNTDNTKKGYLHKIWISSNTQQNGITKNINISNVSVYFYNGRGWQENFYIDFIVIGNRATQVHYFFNDNPDVQIQFKWRNVKINN